MEGGGGEGVIKCPNLRNVIYGRPFTCIDNVVFVDQIIKDDIGLEEDQTFSRLIGWIVLAVGFSSLYGWSKLLISLTNDDPIY